MPMNRETSDWSARVVGVFMYGVFAYFMMLFPAQSLIMFVAAMASIFFGVLAIFWRKKGVLSEFANNILEGFGITAMSCGALIFVIVTTR